jgi:tetratricopeptide (TPR) repeat protein
MFFGLASFQVGVIRYLQRDYPAAIRSLEQALQAQEHPGDELYALLGRVYLSADQKDEARRIVDQGRDKFPESVPLAGLSAELAYRGGDSARGEREIAGLLETAGGSEEGYLEVIQLAGRLGNFREASRRCTEGLARHPDSIPLRFQDAALEERRGKVAESEKKFRSLLALKPDYAEALNYLGYMLADRGVKLTEARAMVEKALSIEPANAAYLDSLGWVHFRLKDYARAEELLRRAVPASREDSTILEHLGDVLDATGRRREALDSYRQARERGPENAEALDRKIRRLERHAGGK